VSPGDGAERVEGDPRGAATGRGSDAAAAPSAERPFEQRPLPAHPRQTLAVRLLLRPAREDVLSACAKTAAFMAGAAVILRPVRTRQDTVRARPARHHEAVQLFSVPQGCTLSASLLPRQGKHVFVSSCGSFHIFPSPVGCAVIAAVSLGSSVGIPCDHATALVQCA